MNKLRYSPEAQNDLFEIKKYIEEELNSPIAAENTLHKIIKRIRTLQDHSQLGPSLSSIIDFDTDYRFLICGNYIAFYYFDEENIYIVRVLYSRRNYIKILFGSFEENSIE